MCLFNVTTKRTKTLKPITVWKVIRRYTLASFKTGYQFEFQCSCKLEFDKVLKAESPYLTAVVDIPKVQHYRSGFHSFKYIAGADLWSDKTEDDVIVRCTIPAGSYIQAGIQQGHDIIVSSQIIIHKPGGCNE